MPKYIAIHFVNFHPSEETEIICPIAIEIYLLISSAKFHHLYIDIERVEFDRTGQWIGMGLMEACLQADTIQAGDGSTEVLLSQQINFLRFPREIKIGSDYSHKSPSLTGEGWGEALNF